MEPKRRAGFMSKIPIEQWYSLIQSNLSEVDILASLKKIYVEHPPVLAELIVESYCPSQCQHCIYPPDYHKNNKVLTEQQWQLILHNLYADLGFRTYVFGGRHLTRKIINVISYLKRNFSDAGVGLIADCRDLEALLTDVEELEPDWVDISIDGLQMEHDLQRGKIGAFDQALRVIRELKDSSFLSKVNILPCLTTINMASVVEMIGILNAEGFKNFFISPVTVVKNFRPAQRLAPSNKDFVCFIDKLLARSVTLTDSWVEINIYDVRYFVAIKQLRPDLFSSFTYKNDHFEYVKEVDENEVHINFYPISLAGINEFIVNSNGDIIPPKVVAEGIVGKDMVFTNMLDWNNEPDFFAGMMDKKAFNFYLAELLREKSALAVN